MKRWILCVFVVVGFMVSAAIGFWFGFREAFPLGVAADHLPRGAIATVQLNALRAGNTQNLVTALEFDVDHGLLWGNEVFRHPLRNYLGPVWGFNIYPDYEKYATRLADYRRTHPSLMRADAFETVPPIRSNIARSIESLRRGHAKTSPQSIQWLSDMRPNAEYKAPNPPLNTDAGHTPRAG